MNQKYFKILVIGISLVSIWVVLSIGLGACTKKKKPIKIGAILSLSGVEPSVGHNVKDGMLMAIDEVNSWGGVNGRQLELIIEDSRSDPESGKLAFSKLESDHQPQFYVSILSSVSVAVAPLAARNEVVLIGLVATAPKLTKQNEWVFRYYPTALDEVPPIISLLKDLKVKKTFYAQLKGVNEKMNLHILESFQG